MMMLLCIEAQFMKKLSNNESELKKSTAYKKNHTHVKNVGHTSEFQKQILLKYKKKTAEVGQ